MLCSVALALEYEAICTAPMHVEAAGLGIRDAMIFVDAVLAMAEPVRTYFHWRPQLRDPGDEMVLEVAVNGRASIISTFNERDFGAVPARFGVEIMGPAAVLRRIRQ